jgi:hypothetical protein
MIKIMEHAHHAPIRDIKYLPTQHRFVTVGNDSYLKEWDEDLNLISETFVDLNYLYAVVVLDEARFRYATGGEDPMFAIVEDGHVVDGLPIPNTIRSFATLPTHDLVVGCSNGSVYIFTESSDRRAPERETALYLSALTGWLWPSRFGDVELDTLPDFGDGSKVACKGTLFARGKERVIGTWSNGYQEWLQVGTLPPEVGPAPEEFQLPVELEDRSFVLRLQGGQNEYLAARNFLLSNGLPMKHLEPIAQFLRQALSHMISDHDYSSIRPEFTPDSIGNNLPLTQAQMISTALQEFFVSAREKILAGAPPIEYLARLGTVFGRPEARDLAPTSPVIDVITKLSEGSDLKHPLVLGLFADVFQNYADDVIPIFDQAQIVARTAAEFGSLVDDAKTQFARFVFNFACYASDRPVILVAIGQNVGRLIQIDLAAHLDMFFLKAVDITVTYVPESAEQIRPLASEWPSLLGRPGISASVLMHLDAILTPTKR